MKTNGDTVIRRSGGVSKTIFILSLVIVAAISGVSGYFIAGVLKPSQSTIILNGAGATFPYPFLSAASINYSRTNPSVQVNYQSIGSGGEQKALITQKRELPTSTR